MTCPISPEKTYDYLFDLLDDAERGEVERHVASCDECRRTLAAARHEQELLKHWAAPAPPSGLAERTVSAARAESEQKGGRAMQPNHVEPEFRWLGSRRFWAVAAMLLLVLGLGIAAKSWHMTTRHAGPQQAFLYGGANLTPGMSADYRVFVRNELTQRPVAGANVRVRLVSASGKVVLAQAVRTDANGFAAIESVVPDSAAEGDYTIKVVADSPEGTSDLSRPVVLKRSFRVMVTTDKPMYQPGQTIHIRTLSLATADLRPVTGRDIVLEVQDAKGNKVFKKRLATSSFGVAAADFELADQVNAGTYTVAAQLGDTRSEKSVTVERYVLPKFKIDLATDKGYYAPGTPLSGDLTAEYTFGKPVAGAKVRIVASEFIETFRPFATVDGVTDTEGRFHFEIRLKDHFVGQERTKGDAFVSLEATVTDKADHAQKKTLERIVTSSPIRIEVFPESGSLVHGVENILYVVTAYPDGRPAKTKLTLGATQKLVETSDIGIARVKITPETDALKLTVTAVDDRGVRAQVTTDLRVGSRSETLLLRTDRAIYKAGETATVTLLSADRVGRVFLDLIKDRRTMLQQTIDVADGKGELAFDLPPEIFGTLELHAYRIMTDGNITGDARIIQVNRADDLHVSAQFDKDSYRPGEKAFLTFLVTRANGDPTQAALGLAGVDEAVFALSEMRPGLERVYFLLQEEILKPRYEIHAQLPLSPADTVLPGKVPTPEAQEATIVLFSAAEGGGAPEARAGETYRQRDERFRRERVEYFDNLAWAGILSPFGLYVLLSLPVIFYALVRLFRRGPVEGAPALDVLQLRARLGSLTTWWLFALYLPVLGTVLGGLLGRSGEAALAGLLLTTLLMTGVLFFSAHRVRRLPLSRFLPLLRKLVALVPFLYLLPAAGFCLAAGSTTVGHSGEGEDMMLLLGLASYAVAFLVFGALAIARACATRRVSVGRWFWLAVSRPLGAAVPFIVLAGFLLPALAPAGEHARMALPQAALALRAEMFREKGFADGPVDALEDKQLAEKDKKDADGLQGPTRIRRFFPETLFWRPELITDEAGRARMELELADSITTWRISMNAVSARGELGEATAPLRVFQDFFVDIDFPVALTQHDRVSVPVAVYNYLDRPQKVRLEVEGDSWFNLLDERVKTLDIGAKEVSAVYFTLEAQMPGRHSLTVKAFGSAMGDAVERTVRVEPDGKPVVETINGRLDKNLPHEIVIPDAAIDGASDLLVKIYPGAFSQVVEGLDSIFQMPGGCFEQTSSSTYPNVLVLDYLRRTKQVKPEVEMKALNYINLGYQRLLSYEVKGGGFSWFGQVPAHNVLTGYGLMEFSDMAKVFDVDPAVIQRTSQWLMSLQRPDGSWEPTQGGIAEGAINNFQGAVLRTTAYVAWALAESGTKESGLGRAIDYIGANADDKQDTYTLALCANALVSSKSPKAAGVLKRLVARVVVEGEKAHWTSTGEGATFSRGNTLDVETTALAAYAMLQSNTDVTTAHKALEWLVANKDPRGTWYSTQATVHAMRALLAGTGAGGGIEGDVNITVAANGRLAQEIRITPDTADVFRLVSLTNLVRRGRNTVAIEAAGKGSLAYQIVATHYVPWKGEERPEGKEMSIDVQYDTTMLKKDDALKCNVTVLYNRPGAAKMTIVDLGIPPGFDVLPEAFDALKNNGVIQRWSMTGRQVILYFDTIEGRKPVNFTYTLRAKFPVKVKTPPSTVYQYYEPGLRDQASPVELTVM